AVRGALPVAPVVPGRRGGSVRGLGDRLRDLDAAPARRAAGLSRGRRRRRTPRIYLAPPRRHVWRGRRDRAPERTRLAPRGHPRARPRRTRIPGGEEGGRGEGPRQG